MSAIAGPPVAPYPVVQQDEKGDFVEIQDMRMPWYRKLIQNKSLSSRDTWYIYPKQQAPTFYRSAIGDGKVTFEISGRKDILINWENSYIELGVIPIVTGTTALTSGNIDDWQYLAPTAGAAGAVKFMAWPGTHALFKKWKVADMRGNPTFDEVEASDVFTQVQMAGQKPEFYEQDTTQRCGDLAADIIHYRDDRLLVSNTTSRPTAARLIPWDPDVAFTAAAVTTGGGEKLALKEVRRVFKNMIGGERLKVFPASDFVFTTKFHYPGACPLSLQLTMNTFDEAFYGVDASCTNNATNWTTSKYGVDYQIVDMKLVLDVFRMTDIAKNQLDTLQVENGYTIDYDHVIHESDDLEGGTTYQHTFKHAEISDLKKIIMVVRESSNVQQSCLYPKHTFTNGELGTSSVAADDATYEGITSIQWQYLSEYFPRAPVAIAPYNMRNIRDYTGELWTGEENTLLASLYEGLIEGVYTKHAGTQFFIAWDFEKQPGAYKSGLDLNRGTLTLHLTLGTAGHNKLHFDYWLLVGSEVTVQAGYAGEPKL